MKFYTWLDEGFHTCFVDTQQPLVMLAPSVNCSSSFCPLYNFTYSKSTSTADLLCKGGGYQRGYAMINSDGLWTSCWQWTELSTCMDSLVICMAAASFSYILSYIYFFKRLSQACAWFNLIHKIAANIQCAVISRREGEKRSIREKAREMGNISRGGQTDSLIKYTENLQQQIPHKSPKNSLQYLFPLMQ